MTIGTNGTGNGNGHDIISNGLLPRPVPHNEEAERGVLGSILLDADVLHLVGPILAPSDFYRDDHQALYRVILDLSERGAPIDGLTVADELVRLDRFEAIGGYETMAAILGGVPHTANAAYYAQIVRETARLRAVAEIAAEMESDAYSGRFVADELIARGSGRLAEIDDGFGDLDFEVSAWPAPPDDAAFGGLAGQIVRLVEPYTDADPIAILAQFLAGFGSLVGRHAYVRVQATHHYPNLFLAICGATARARKGTSWDVVTWLLESSDEDWVKDRVKPGLVSGEGLVWAVRDDVVEDKRLLCIESEFGSTMRVMARDGSSLSGLIKQSWDSGRLSTMRTEQPVKATGAHVSIVGHVTIDEVMRTLRHVDVSSGFANRFLWVCVQKSRLLPRGAKMNKSNWAPALNRLGASVDAARQLGEMDFTADAERLWCASYADLVADRPGLLGSILARSDAQALRLALVYALVDGADVIEASHLESALALWRYVERSAEFIFGDALGDANAEKLLAALRAAPEGLTRNQIFHAVFSRHVKAWEVKRVLGVLTRTGLAHFRTVPTTGRPAQLWFAGAQPPGDPPAP